MAGSNRMTAVSVVVAVGAIVAAGVGALWLSSPAPPDDGPAPITWDREACAHCRMHIGEPGYAAQIRLGDGTSLSFDDPGCLFQYVDEHHPDVARRWFHHADEDRWLSGGEVGFVRRSPTPMGFGLAAVDAQAASMGLDEARRFVLEGRFRAPDVREARGGDAR